MQFRAHRFISEFILGQTKRSVISFVVALIPGCESPCSCWNIFLRQVNGTKGRLLLVEVSQMMDASEKGMGTDLRFKLDFSLQTFNSASSACNLAKVSRLMS